MAKRQGFIVTEKNTIEVLTVDIPFRWGDYSSVRDNIVELHTKLSDASGSNINEIMEISTASDSMIGRDLSPFRLTIDGNGYLESYYQSTKVFKYGSVDGSVKGMKPTEAKRYVKDLHYGTLIGFSDFYGDLWGIDYSLAFFNRIYLLAIYNSYNRFPMKYKSMYTDIYANPEKSINCNARAVALAQLVDKSNNWDCLKLNKQDWIEYHNSIVKG